MVQTKSTISIHADQRASRPGNLVHKVRARSLATHVLVSFISGAVLSSAFAPFEYSLLAWIGLIPILHLSFLPNSRSGLFGYAFGFGHFVTTFAWLREVFILAPIGIAAVWAAFPAIWLRLSKSVLENLKFSPEQDLLPRNDPSIATPSNLSTWKLNVLIVAVCCTWCGMEWCRSWFLSGFPWNQLGITQWQNRWMLPLSMYTGVYGVSFLIVMVNATIYFSYYQRRETGATRKSTVSRLLIWPVAAFFIGVVVQKHTNNNSGESETLKIAAIQGNIPQIRQWNPEQLNLALSVYTHLTKRIVADSKPDLVVWPETAVPASLTHNEQCAVELQRLFKETKTPLVAGSITYRFPYHLHQPQDLPRTYNSALLFDESGQVIDHYDKIHLVPFGEYVPFEKYLPWLVEWIGMGRSLTAGKEYTVIPFSNTVRIGINICYEDIFPAISSRMVRAGANLLLVITNDAWFGETSGSRQHLAHTVFRAVENSRPVLRNGNNSDTCLILPDGRTVDILYNPGNGNRFVRTAGDYEVPIVLDPPLTVYSRYGDWFATMCFVVTLVFATWCFYRLLSRKQRLYTLIRQDELIP